MPTTRRVSTALGNSADRLGGGAARNPRCDESRSLDGAGELGERQSAVEIRRGRKGAATGDFPREIFETQVVGPANETTDAPRFGDQPRDAGFDEGVDGPGRPRSEEGIGRNGCAQDERKSHRKEYILKTRKFEENVLLSGIRPDFPHLTRPHAAPVIARTAATKQPIRRAAPDEWIASLRSQ